MPIPTQTRSHLAGYGVSLAAAFCLFAAGCSSGGGGGDDSDSEVEIAIDTGSEGENIVLANGVPQTIRKQFDYDVAASGGPFVGMAVDFSDPATLQMLSAFMHLNGAFPQGQQVAGTVVFYVGATGQINDESECTNGVAYGPFTITVANGAIASVSPANQAATQATLDIVNTGTIVVCAVFTPTADATLSVGGVPAIGDKCREATANIAGTWTGTFSCDGAPDQNIELTITQSGDTATYIDDIGARYAGTVCGRSFSFDGGLADAYDESGTFVMNQDGMTGTKVSYYSERPYNQFGAAGTCVDELARQ